MPAEDREAEVLDYHNIYTIDDSAKLLVDLRWAIKKLATYLYKECQHSHTILGFLRFCYIRNIFSYVDNMKL